MFAFHKHTFQSYQFVDPFLPAQFFLLFVCLINLHVIFIMISMLLEKDKRNLKNELLIMMIRLCTLIDKIGIR